MASSKSLLEGQTPISCQLCEESNEIKWKCIECDFLLCTKCQKIHEKVKSTYQHTIIDIKDIASHQQQAKENKYFHNIPCEIHSGQNCCLFCQTCDEVVCPLCIAITHKKHNMIELVEGYTLTVKKLKTFNHELDKQLANYERGRSSLSSFKSSEDFKYEREKQKIMSREKLLKDEVEMHTKSLQKELDQRWDLQSKLVKDANIKSKQINKDLEYRTECLTNAFSSVNACDVFSACKREISARKRNTELVSSCIKRLPQYVPGNILNQQTLHGQLNASGDDFQYALDQYDPKVIKQYKTRMQSVARIVCCDEGTLWINYNRTEILQKIQFSNGQVNIIKEISIFLSDMALLPSGDLLISIKEPNLKIICYTTGKITKSKYSVAPLITGAIHVTLDDKIVIRTRKKGPVFPVEGTRQVVVMDIKGKSEKKYDLDNNGKPIFSAPQRIETDSDNNLYVLDRLNTDKCGRIVALDKTNGVRWIYSGNPGTSKGQVIFKPSDLAATKLNNIIITDMQGHMLYILNSSGQCIFYMNTIDQLGIHCPISLGIDNRGKLYIGCGKYATEPNGAKIYNVQFSGF